MLSASGMATPFYPKIQKYCFSKIVSHMLRLGKISDHMWGGGEQEVKCMDKMTSSVLYPPTLKQNKQLMYNVSFWHVHVTFAAMETQCVPVYCCKATKYCNILTSLATRIA
jgi:hypothetical protein